MNPLLIKDMSIDAAMAQHGAVLVYKTHDGRRELRRYIHGHFDVVAYVSQRACAGKSIYSGTDEAEAVRQLLGRPSVVDRLASIKAS
jgi:hypothetical protein